MVKIKPEDLNIVVEEQGAEGVEYDLIKDSVLDMANTDFSYTHEVEPLPVGSIGKRAAIIGMGAYEGKPVTRKQMMKEYWSTMDDPHLNDDDREGDESDESGDLNSLEELEEESGEEDMDNESGVEEDLPKNASSDSESEIEDDSDFKDDAGYFDLDTYQNQTERKTEERPFALFSSSISEGVKQDIEKGKAIRNQLSTWETLLECRIKLQKGLLASNRLYQHEDFQLFKDKLETEEKSVLTKTRTGLSELMNALLELQDVMLKCCTDYGKTKEEMEGKKTEKEDKDEPELKKMKLSEYGDLLEKQYSKYKPFRDSIIQKWNDRTRVISGKINSSDLDQSTLKQIEQILCDKSRLLRRTQLKRSQYSILGKTKMEKTSNESEKKDANTNEYDTEIFDDDDFYHKLLRDFLDRKTSDITDPTQLGRRWVELQKYRSKMKRKIDVRATKGRRLRFTVHNKLVNFMAPIPYNTWSTEAENKLFCSLFGKAGLRSILEDDSTSRQ